jgi:hypothetical protein
MVIDPETGGADVSVCTATMYLLCDSTPDDRKSEPGRTRLLAVPLRSSGVVGGRAAYG